MAQERRIERFRLGFMASETSPVFREGLDEPGHSENGEHAFRRSTVKEVIGKLGDARY